MGHNRDFTLGYWPRASVSQERWVLVDVAMGQPGGVPPIEVFQISDKYFVADGSHRVSVAKANGLHDIEAYVTVVTWPAEDPTDAPVDTRPAQTVAALKPIIPSWLRRLWDHAAAFVDDLLTA